MVKVGLIVNPIAGMGGRVGLKGTDDLYEEALRRGAKPVAPLRTRRFLDKLVELNIEVYFLVAPKIMGEDYISRYKQFKYKVIGDINIPTSRWDTIRCASTMLREIDVLAFVGGDGTARDIMEAINMNVPVIGIPSGVKMFSPVFTITPEKAAELLKLYIEGEANIVKAEVLDIDEEAYRNGRLTIRLHGYLLTVRYPFFVQGSKTVTPLSEANEEIRSIAEYIVDNMEKNTLYITGPGNTVKEIHRILSLKYTLLGVDAIYNEKVVGLDLNEIKLLNLLKRYRRHKLVISPIGGQGILLGRGNQVISPKVLMHIGLDNIIVIAPYWKLNTFKCMFVDTGDPKIDKEFPDYVKVLYRYGEYKVVKVCK